MFAKTALVATIAVAAQALTLDTKPVACINGGKFYAPLNMAGQGRTVMTAEQCQKRCQDTHGCKYFNWWANKGCHISDGSQGLKSSSAAMTGARDCLSQAQIKKQEEDEAKAAAAQAAIANARRAPVVTSTFANDDFLMGGLDSFEAAEKAREVYMAEHMRRNLARRQAAHVYYSAKDVAAEKVRIEGEFNVAWLKAVTVHENAILDHNNAKESTIAAANKKRLAILAHLQATEAANKTDALRAHALAAWNDSKIATAEARDNKTALDTVKAQADAAATRAANVLATKLGEEEAAKVEHNKRDSDNNAALASKATALSTENDAKAMHTAAEQAQARANTAETNAARARAAAFTSHKDAVEKTKLAIAEKAAALARARFASKAVRDHMQANWMYAL